MRNKRELGTISSEDYYRNSSRGQRELLQPEPSWLSKLDNLTWVGVGVSLLAFCRAIHIGLSVILGTKSATTTDLIAALAIFGIVVAATIITAIFPRIVRCLIGILALAVIITSGVMAHLDQLTAIYQYQNDAGDTAQQRAERAWREEVYLNER